MLPAPQEWDQLNKTLQSGWKHMLKKKRTSSIWMGSLLDIEGGGGGLQSSRAVTLSTHMKRTLQQRHCHDCGSHWRPITNNSIRVTSGWESYWILLYFLLLVRKIEVLRIGIVKNNTQLATFLMVFSLDSPIAWPCAVGLFQYPKFIFFRITTYLLVLKRNYSEETFWVKRKKKKEKNCSENMLLFFYCWF